MRFGLAELNILKIKSLFNDFPDVQSVKIFGSRSLGTFKEGSDIDLALFGLNITPKLIRTVQIRYHDLNLPYKLDLIHFESIDNEELKKHILTNGQSF